MPKGLAGSRAGGEGLVGGWAAGKASARLLQEFEIAVRLGMTKVPDVKNRVAKLTRGLPSADKRLQELLDVRRSSYQQSPGDAVAGFKIFQKHSAACHAIAHKG